MQIRAYSNTVGRTKSEWSDHASIAVLEKDQLDIPIFRLDSITTGARLTVTTLDADTNDYVYQYASTRAGVSTATERTAGRASRPALTQNSGNVYCRVKAKAPTALYIDSEWAEIHSIQAGTRVQLVQPTYSSTDFYRVPSLGEAERGFQLRNITASAGATAIEIQWADNSAYNNPVSTGNLPATTTFREFIVNNFGRYYVRVRCLAPGSTTRSTSDWNSRSVNVDRPTQLGKPTFTLTPHSNGIDVIPNLPSNATGYLIRWGLTASLQTDNIIVAHRGTHRVPALEGETLYIRIRSLSTSTSVSASDYTTVQNSTTIFARALTTPINRNIVLSGSNTGVFTGINIRVENFPTGTTGWAYRIGTTQQNVLTATSISRLITQPTVGASRGPGTYYVQIRWTTTNVDYRASPWSFPFEVTVPPP